MKRPLLPFLAGAATGLANGLFGAGGGLLAVFLLNRCGIDKKSSHATALALTLPLSLISAIILLCFGTSLPLGALCITILCGLPGAWLGTVLLKKISPTLLSRIFGIVMVVSAVRMFLR